MTNADDKQVIASLWEHNYLNVRRATAIAKESGKKIVVGVELYDVSIDRQNKLFPWAAEALSAISPNSRYSLNIWSIYNDSTMRWFRDNVFTLHKIKIDGMNDGIFVFEKDFSPVKPIIDICIDTSSGFETRNWYWLYHLFRLSDAMLSDRDNSVIRNVVTGNEKYSVRPTTVKIPNDGIPVAKPFTPNPK
jgi:hypothetical protein